MQFYYPYRHRVDKRSIHKPVRELRITASPIVLSHIVYFTFSWTPYPDFSGLVVKRGFSVLREPMTTFWVPSTGRLIYHRFLPLLSASSRSLLEIGLL